jgi:hypothetical protein
VITALASVSAKNPEKRITVAFAAISYCCMIEMSAVGSRARWGPSGLSAVPLGGLFVSGEPEIS